MAHFKGRGCHAVYDSYKHLPWREGYVWQGSMFSSYFFPHMQKHTPSTSKRCYLRSRRWSPSGRKNVMERRTVMERCLACRRTWTPAKTLRPKNSAVAQDIQFQASSSIEFHVFFVSKTLTLSGSWIWMRIVLRTFTFVLVIEWAF